MATKAKFHETEAVLRAALAGGDLLRGPHLQKIHFSAAGFPSAMRYSAYSSPAIWVAAYANPQCSFSRMHAPIDAELHSVMSESKTRVFVSGNRDRRFARPRGCRVSGRYLRPRTAGSCQSGSRQRPGQRANAGG